LALELFLDIDRPMWQDFCKEDQNPMGIEELKKQFIVDEDLLKSRLEPL